MFQDYNLTFDPSGTAITASAVSTNVLDLGANRDLGVGLFRGKPITQITATFTAAAQTATLNVQLQGAPDNGSGSPGGYTTLADTNPLPIGMLVAGARIAQFDVPTVANQIAPQSAAGTTATFTSGASSITVSNASGIQAGQFINGPGITPGTTVASTYTLASTTVPLSANTTAAGAAVAVSFTTLIPPPRFLRQNYVVAGGPFTAGALLAAIFGDPQDALIYYKPGFTQPY